ncbi:MAG: glycogen debranching protein GlgX [Brachybacterium sp.]|nr:glycogen debranching protein GlgX [Brachybacterium sp.]
MPAVSASASRPARTPRAPGLDVDAEGRGTFAVVAPRAHAMDLCVLRDGIEERHRLRHYDGGMWWDEVQGFTPGTLYGLRADGPWQPEIGLVPNPAKLLLDPRARAVSHTSPLASSMFAHQVDALLDPVPDAEGQLRIDPEDNAEEAVWSVVVPAQETPGGPRPRTPWDRTVLYELHVKGFTQTHPGIPSELRGTYAGLSHPAAIAHLHRLGVTAVELLPVHAIMDEAHLTRLGLPNYWGYSTLSYFAPEPSYATAAAQEAGGQAVVEEFRAMVAQLHAAGLEVILDVVYNHSAEGGADGPSLSLRGLDAREHYWMHGPEQIDVTGTGGTLDMRSQSVVDLILSSLRHWVTEMGVDGFRFDLAATLGRDDHGFRPDHPLLRAIALDPVLRECTLIAEPWDVGPDGWQTGNFPPPFAEWNDRFRDDIRSFWLADRAARRRSGDRGIGGIRGLATRMAGSADLFARHDHGPLPPGKHRRHPWASINYITSHDGFTLADLTAYERKHNEANGEHNRDGTDNNRSYHHGHEGPVSAEHPHAERILASRQRTQRALLATLLLAAGTPMLMAGDEIARTQAGNNNAYCQDGPISWVSWDTDADREHQADVVAELLRLRQQEPALRPPDFLRVAEPDALHPDQVAWFGVEGHPLGHEDWMDTGRHTLQMLRPGAAGAPHLLVILCAEDERTEIHLPSAPWPDGTAQILFDSAGGTAPVTGGRVVVDGPTVLVLRIAA